MPTLNLQSRLVFCNNCVSVYLTIKSQSQARKLTKKEKTCERIGKIHITHPIVQSFEGQQSKPILFCVY